MCACLVCACRVIAYALQAPCAVADCTLPAVAALTSPLLELLTVERSAKSHRLKPAQCAGDHRGMTDGLAILQATLIIATLGIFVLGGSIKDVAVCCGVLKRAPAPV